MRKDILIHIGDRYGKLTIINYIHGLGKTRFQYKCDCGKIGIAKSSHRLRKGRQVSCGCQLLKYRHSKNKKRTRTHGLRHTPEYRVWANMKRRCSYSNHPQAKNYKNRGINICNEWLEFENFYKDMGPRPLSDSSTKISQYSIERLDNNLGYSPENCIWATQKTQCNNRQKSIKIYYLNNSYSLSELAQLSTFPFNRIYRQLQKRKNCLTNELITKILNGYLIRKRNKK